MMMMKTNLITATAAAASVRRSPYMKWTAYAMDMWILCMRVIHTPIRDAKHPKLRDYMWEGAAELIKEGMGDCDIVDEPDVDFIATLDGKAVKGKW